MFRHNHINDKYAEYVHSIMDHEFYIRKFSPAELFRGVDDSFSQYYERPCAMYSPRWWERWFRWQFQCNWIDDEEGFEYHCRGLEGADWYENILVDKYGRDNVERYVAENKRDTRVPMTTAYSRYSGPGPNGRRIDLELGALTDPLNTVTWNISQQTLEPGLVEELCSLRQGEHWDLTCCQFDDHIGEWLGFNHSEPLDTPHQELVYPKKEEEK